jgi:DNA replication protein DnaC
VRWVTGEDGYERAFPCDKCSQQRDASRLWARVDPDPQAARRFAQERLEQVKTQPKRTQGQEPARAALEQWAKHPRHARAVVLLGPPGRGKTYLASRALHDGCVTHGHTGLYLRESQFVRAWQCQFGEQDREWGAATYAQAGGVTLLVLDDVAAQASMTPGAQEQVQELVCRRYDAGLGLVITTNLAEAGLEKALGARAWSRLQEMAAGRIVALQGRDWRQQGQRGAA